MNLTIAVTGAAGAGKTLFCINFAEHLGARSLCYSEIGPHGRGRGALLPRDARRRMVGPGPGVNGAVRTFAVNMPGPQPRRIALIDTAALKPGPRLTRPERRKLVLTLQALQEADTVLHLVDLSSPDPKATEFACQVNRRLADFCAREDKRYLAVGSKRDLAGGNRFPYGLFFSPDDRMPAVSSVTGEGFPALRRLLLDQSAFSQAGLLYS